MPEGGEEKAGFIFEAFWEEPVLLQPSGIGGTNWAPMSYDPETGSFYVPGTIRTSAFARYGDTYKLGLRYTGGTQAAPIGSPMSGTFTALGSNTNKIVWQHKTPYRVGQGGRSTTTAGGIGFRGEPDRNFLAIDGQDGQAVWRVRTPRRRLRRATGIPAYWRRASRRPSPFRSPAATITSARRTRGCTVRSSSSSEASCRGDEQIPRVARDTRDLWRPPLECVTLLHC